MAAADAAQAQVALKYDPQQAAIQRQIEAINAQTQSNEQGLNQYGTQGRAAIGDVYNTLNGLLTGNRQQSASDVAGAVGGIQQGYQQAADYQNQVADQARQRLGSLAQYLGAGPEGNYTQQSALESTLGNILGTNANNAAASANNLRDWGTRWDQILGNGINIGEQTRASKLSDFETQLMQLLGQNKVSGLESTNDMQGRLADILSARQNDLVATYNQLAQQDWENAFKQAQLDQQASAANADNALKARGLDLQAASQADDNAYRSAQLSKGDNLSPKEMLQFMLQQQGMQADQGQQQWDNNLKWQQLGLDRANSAADIYGKLQGNNPNGNQLLAQYAMSPDVAGDPQQVSAMAALLDSLGITNNLYSSVPASAPPANAISALTNPGGGGSSGGGGGMSFNPGNWMSSLTKGLGGMWR